MSIGLFAQNGGFFRYMMMVLKKVIDTIINQFK